MNSAGVEQAVSKNDKFASQKVTHNVFKKKTQGKKKSNISNIQEYV